MTEAGSAQTTIIGRSIKLFLADGTPHGLIVADIGNWNGKVLSGPRSLITTSGTFAATGGNRLPSSSPTPCHP